MRLCYWRKRREQNSEGTWVTTWTYNCVLMTLGWEFWYCRASGRRWVLWVRKCWHRQYVEDHDGKWVQSWSSGRWCGEWQLTFKDRSSTGFILAGFFSMYGSRYHIEHDFRIHIAYAKVPGAMWRTICRMTMIAAFPWWPYYPAVLEITYMRFCVLVELPVTIIIINSRGDMPYVEE